MIRPIALTSGEPAGVAPEITVAAWQALRTELPFFLIGDKRHFESAAAKKSVPLIEISDPAAAPVAMSKGVPLIHRAFAESVVPGQVSHPNAPHVIAVIEEAVSFVKRGKASAVCTNPINKQILKEGAGFAHPGHTEFLASLGGVDHSVMMLTAPELRVVPVTIHIALDQVRKDLTADLLQETIRTTRTALIRDFGVQSPRIAVAGLNPHAGEGGAMGSEEIKMIVPALDALRQEGVELTGPLPADTMFHTAAREHYDVAICMYHDQALIPIKTLNFSAGVNVTLGLPFIRTSPDHGTAFDIAGKGIADATSLIEALKTAGQMAEQRAAYDTQNA